MADTIFKGPPQSTHFCMSNPNTRARSSAHFLARGEAGALMDQRQAQELEANGGQFENRTGMGR